MKIETNFAVSLRPLTARVLIGAAVVALVLCAALATLWLNGSARSRETQEALERLTQLESRRASIGDVPNLPDSAEFVTLRERVETVNALSVTHGRRLTPMLALFEELLPDEAWLVKLNHKARDGEVVLIAEANRAEQLTQFLLNLERSSRFAEVLLVRQTPLGAEGRRTVQFELRLKERS